MVCFHSEKMQVIDAKLVCEREHELLYLFNVQPETEGLPPRKYAAPVLGKQFALSLKNPVGKEVVFEYDNNNQIVGVFETKARNKELKHLQYALDSRNAWKLEAFCLSRTYDEIMHLANLLGVDSNLMEERLQQIS